MATLPGGGVGFWLRWEDVEPRDDPAWSWASAALVDRFRKEARRVALVAWDRSRAKGLDRFGQPVAPISEITRDNRRSAMGDADPDAPPLIPAWEKSRTRAFLRSQVKVEGLWCWFKYDPRVRASWGRILTYQAQRGRDVLGFSPAEVAEVRRYMRTWWAARRGKPAADAGLLGLPDGPTDAPIVVRIPEGVRVIPRDRRPPRRPLVGTGVLERVERRAAVGIDTSGGEYRGPGSVYYELRPPQPPPAPVIVPIPPRARPRVPRWLQWMLWQRRAEEEEQGADRG